MEGRTSLLTSPAAYRLHLVVLLVGGLAVRRVAQALTVRSIADRTSRYRAR